ncbi:Glyoxylase, beta-lactamase superfamily II [Halobellus limi]|uniref:Glyoxylase, beta-lactamase superfamily II n=2 Tax=Halobellus limi TaxID=699433 RepID=A0A1H5ZKT8_9EURY|nr:Glyoxylase, beta-lactamase superfamily II [Halobellus limi]
MVDLFDEGGDFAVAMSVSTPVDSIDTVQLDHVRAFVLEDRPAGEVTVIDAGFPDDGAELASLLESEYGGVDRLVVSHGDEGHFGGVPALMEAFDPELLVPGGSRGFYDALDYDADDHFGDGDRLPGGIRVVQIPGHTVANSSFLLEEESVLIACDSLEGSDRRGLPPGYLVPPAEQFNDYSHAAAERNLGKLFDHEISTVLVSHGSHVTDDPLAKLDDWLLNREWTLTYE